MDPVQAPAPAAPAQPVTPPAPPATVSATRAAADKGDFASFDKAHVDAKRGSPHAPVVRDAKPVDAPAAPVDAAIDPAAPQPERKVSNRQQQINEYERRIAEQNERITRLESQLTTPRQDPAKPTAPPVARTFQDELKAPYISRAMLSEQDFFQKYPDAPYAAYARYWERYDTSAESAQRQQQEFAGQRERFTRERSEKFVTSIRNAAKDPTFVEKLHPALLNAEPLSALAPGEPVTFANIVAEAAFNYSENAAALFQYLSEHTAEAAAIAALPQHQVLPALVRLDGRISAPARVAAEPAAPPSPARAVSSPVSAAPPPPPEIKRSGSSSDPLRSALARDDFAAFDQIEMQKRVERRGRA